MDDLRLLALEEERQPLADVSGKHEKKTVTDKPEISRQQVKKNRRTTRQADQHQRLP